MKNWKVQTASEIREKLDNVLDRKDKLEQYGLELLAGKVNSQIFNKENTKEETLEWADLYLYMLLVMKDKYPVPLTLSTQGYDFMSVAIRTEMIKRYGVKEECSVRSLNSVLDWIDLNTLDFDAIVDLKDNFLKTKDRSLLCEFVVVNKRIGALRRLIEYELIKTNEKIELLIKTVNNSSFFSYKKETETE